MQYANIIAEQTLKELLLGTEKTEEISENLPEKLSMEFPKYFPLKLLNKFLEEVP